MDINLALSWPLEGNRADPRKFLVENPIQKSRSYRGGYRGRVPSPAPVPPPLRSRFLYRIFHKKFPIIRPVAFQWPATATHDCFRIAQKRTKFLSDWPLEGNRADSDISCGKSYTKICILRGGTGGGYPPRTPYPPFKIQICV